MDVCSSWWSYFKPGCYIEEWAGAIPRGITKGGSEGLGKTIKEAMEHTDFSGVGTSFGNALSRESENFFKAANIDPAKKIKEIVNNIDLNGVGTSLGNFANREVNNFATASNLDPNQFAARLGDTVQTTHETFLNHVDLGKMGRNVGDNLEKGWDGFELADRAQTVGSDIKDAMDNFSWEIGEGIQKSLGNTLTGIRNEMFHQLPYFLSMGMLTTAVSLGTPLALYYLYYKAKHSIGRPKLATDVNQISLFRTMMSPLSSALSLFSSKKVKPTYNTETTRRIAEIGKAIKNIRRNGGYFQNALFYGPGGTGKTMISHILADESGMSYVKMSGGDLAQYIKRGEHVTELNKLFDKMERSWRPWSTRPWMLFIDEAEGLCKDRSKLPTPELLELQNAFLNRTGTQSKKFMLVMATNRLEDLDPAVLNRMDYKIFIGPPAAEERIGIIKSYLPQFFSSKERRDIFNDALVNDIARQTEGFTGRSLFKLLNAIANHRAMTDRNMLTKEIVLQTVRDFASQEQEIATRKSATQSTSAASYATSCAAPAA